MLLEFRGQATFAVLALVAFLVTATLAPTAFAGRRVGQNLALVTDAGHPVEAARVAVTGHRTGEVAVILVAAVHRPASLVRGAISSDGFESWGISRLAQAHHGIADGLILRSVAVLVRVAENHVLRVSRHDLHGSLAFGLIAGRVSGHNDAHS